MGGGRLRRRAGRAGRGAAADPAGPDRGRQHLGPRQPAAGAVRAPRLPRVPDRRRGTGRATCVTGRPVPAPATDREAARARFGLCRRGHDACSCSAARWARARSTRRRSRRSPARRSGSCTPRRARLRARSTRARPHYDLRDYIDDFGEALLAADLVVARSGGSVFEIAAHGRPAILVPYPHAAADHQTANARWMADGGAARRDPRRGADAARLRSEVDALLADRPRLAEMAGVAPRSRAPTPRARSPPRCSRPPRGEPAIRCRAWTHR